MRVEVRTMGWTKVVSAAAVLGGLLLLAPPARADTPAPEHAWKPLRSAAATATSYLQNNWSRYEENYHPSYVLDENPATAWVEGADGFGENESITLPLSAVRRARALRLRIWNGYQKSMHLWTKNAMPHRVRITVLGSGEAELVAVERDLERVQGPQEVIVDIPHGKGLNAVRLTILSVYEGQKFDDTCISDILVDVDSDVTYNEAAESAKHETLLGWVAGRKETAAYFASKPPEFPFAFTRYTPKKTSLDRGDFKRAFAAREAIAKSLPPARFKPVGKQSVRALPDGLTDTDLHAEDFAELLHGDRLALLETPEPLASHVTIQAGQEQIWTSSARVLRAADQKTIKAVAFDVRDVITERSTWTDTRALLLVYDDAGRLQTAYRSVNNYTESEGEDDFDTVTDTDQIWSFSYDANNKVQSVELTSLARHHRVYANNRAGREREDRRAWRVVLSGVPDKSS
jgi:hypothetical protein